MDDLPPIEPDYSAAQLEEIGRIEYLLEELARLRDRGMVPLETFEAVEAEKGGRRAEIGREALFSGTMKAARGFVDKAPRTALAYAERARSLDPGKLEAWGLSATLHGQLREFDRAIALCREAAGLHGHARLADRVVGLESEKARIGQASAIEEAMARARGLAAGGDLEATLDACREVLRLAPGQFWALSTSLGCLVELGRLDEAEGLAEGLRPASPREAADWINRIRVMRYRASVPSSSGAAKPSVGPELGVLSKPASNPPSPVPTGPSFSTVAREFLEEHWQKLILSLAVLLIVVSSTVGAAMVLGDRLWMAEGKCLLATAYTLMFAGFGRGLSRWGADRAGRIMRLTTLIVLPVNFALVGELPGLGRSSSLGLAVLALDSVAMTALAWMVCRSLGISGGKATPAALIGLGMINALTPRSTSFGWGFGMALGASTLFAASGEWLARSLGRRKDPDGDHGEEAPYFAFGLLAFSYLSVMARLGVVVLQMPPTLYALPAMLAAFAAVRVADGLRGSGRADPRVALLRVAGYGLSVLAFALGLARPEVRLPLYSGNTLAVALVGLALYGRALWSERRPAFLYAGFAALFLAYFGAHGFFKDYLSAFEASVGGAMGYRGKLPVAFRALNGLAFNAILGGLALVFSRRWADDRLARHCHWIGLPMAIAACGLSAIEPLAGVLTMGLYVLAFGLATWVFSAPWVAYLACAAFAGAAVSGMSYLGDLTAGGRSLALASVGLVLWASCRLLAIARVGSDYREPVVRSSRVVAVLALIPAIQSAWPSNPPSWSAAGAGWVLATLYVLIGLESPIASVALAASACAAVASLLTFPLVFARLGWPDPRAWLGAWSAAVGLIYQSADPWLKHLGDRRGARLDRPSRLLAYDGPLLVLGLILAGLATWLAGTDLGSRLPEPSSRDFLAVASTMALVCLGLVVTTRWKLPQEWLAHPASLAGAAAMVAGLMALRPSFGWPPAPWLSASEGAVGLILVGMDWRARRWSEGWVSVYRRPLLASAYLAVALSWGSSLAAWPDSRALTLALVLTAATLATASCLAPDRPLAHLALANGLAAWASAWGAAGFDRLEDLPRFGLLVLLYLVVCLAASSIGRRLTRPGEVHRVLGAVLPEFAVGAVMVGLAMGAVGLRTGDWGRLSWILALGSVVLLRVAATRRWSGLIPIGLVLAWLATGSGARWMIGEPSTGVVLGWLAVVTAMDGLIVGGLGWLGRRRGISSIVLGSLDDMGVLLAAAGFAMGVAGPVLSVGAYPESVSALLLTSLALVMSAWMGRSTWRVYGAIFAGVAAAYFTLYRFGRVDPGHLADLGVLASLLAIATWGIGRLASRAAWGDWHPVFATPLRDSTIALAALGVVPEWGQAGPLLLASVPFLLLVKSVPHPGWLYPAMALMLASEGFAVAGRWGVGSLEPWMVATAFGCWGLGLALARWKPEACRRLGLPAAPGYEFPPHHASILLGALAIGLRLEEVIGRGEPWAARPWLAASVAVLSILMLKPFPARGWVDGFVALLTLAAVQVFGLRIDSATSWGLAALSMALIWRLAERGAARSESGACRSLGVGFERISSVFDQWSLGLMILGGLPVALRVIASVYDATLAGSALALPLARLEWWEGLVAILLLGANLELAGRGLPGLSSRFALHPTATLGLWWLAVDGSPIAARLGLSPGSTLPLVAVAQALVTARLVARPGDRPVAPYGAGLALAGVVLTGGRLDAATSATLLIASAATGWIAVSSRGRVVAGLASILWGLALYAATDQAARRLGWSQPANQPTLLGLSQAVAGLGLVVAGGRGRRRASGLAGVWEGSAAASLAVAATAVVLSGPLAESSAHEGRAMIGVGVMGAVGSLCVVLASRWSSMTMAFAAQASILLGFAAYRSGFATSPAGDAAAMLILAGIDLGVAEVAGRGRRLFALPALVTALAMPLISVGLALRGGVVGDESLFFLFAAGTFYAATCTRLRWKGLGYAAAVLYNAALWVLWSRFGWRVADAPQFYLVPVGFSAILFVEANVGDLGRSRVNAIRGLGLTLIYLALAVPIWKTSSLGAWAAVLGISLAGIFAGIGLRSQAFLWLGLAGFLLDVLFQLGRIGMEHALAKWAIMLALGILLFLFVALNEKRRLLATIKEYVDTVRRWE